MATGFRDITREVRRRLTEVRDDVRGSTDASLLVVLRVLGLLYGPIDRRARIDEALRRAMGYRLAPQAGWRHALGGIAYFLLMILVGTGVLLAFYYRPSAQEAYPSLQHVVASVPFGWLLRDMHAWAATLVVVVVFLHLVRSWAEATYRAPRETNWLVGLLLLAVLLAFGISGSLLPWDQWAYWTSAEALDTLGRTPLVGGLATELLQGDDVVSGATLSRFFAVHVIVLPWLLLGLITLHFTLVRKHGVAPVAYGAPPAGTGVRFYPHQFTRILGTAAAVLAVTISLAALFPRPFAPPADPGLPPAELTAMWVATPAWRALLHLAGWGAAGLVVLLGLVLMLLPLLDRGPELKLRARRGALILGLVTFGGVLVASAAGLALRGHGPKLGNPAVEGAVVPFGEAPAAAPGPVGQEQDSTARPEGREP